ncbi:MAG TPA: hypothetical protein V6D07_01030 [Trichocoleus sp.]
MSQNLTIQPTILLIEPDDAARPVLMDNLRRWGYSLVVALDEADAIGRTKDRGHSFDLLLMNQFRQSIEHFIAVGKDIRQQAGLPSSTPIVVMAEHYGAELEGQNLQVGENEYVTYLEDGEQLKCLLYQLCSVLEER